MGQKHHNGSSKKGLQQALQMQQNSNPDAGTEPKKVHRTGRRRKDSDVQPTVEGQQTSSVNEPIALPSQAEGEREMSPANSANQVSMMDQSAAKADVKGPKPTPSQAEGDRDTIDEDLQEKGLQ